MIREELRESGVLKMNKRFEEKGMTNSTECAIGEVNEELRIEHDLVKCWLLLTLGQTIVKSGNASLIGVGLRHNWKRAKARGYR